VADALVQVVELVVRHGEVLALDRVAVSVGRGEVVAVSGRSGAGKTTLVSAIAGVVRPEAGVVRVGGAVVDGRAAAVRAGVVVVPQGNALVSVLTAAENVLLPLRAAGLAAAEARERAGAALAAVGLTDFGDHLVDELSGGQQQRVAVARGLAVPASVLLADEATSELDHGNRERVLALLRARADDGAGVLLTTHDPEAARSADRVVVLDDGRLLPRAPRDRAGAAGGLG
jgi:putative ABC transport system ATP-binding protein